MSTTHNDGEKLRLRVLENAQAEYDEAMSCALRAQTMVLRSIGEEALKNVVILPLPQERDNAS